MWWYAAEIGIRGRFFANRIKLDHICVITINVENLVCPSKIVVFSSNPINVLHLTLPALNCTKWAGPNNVTVATNNQSMP